MKIMFLGAPGAGKGTQAENVSARFNIPAISTGAIIRAAIKNDTEMGKAAKSYIDSGALVPDEVVIGIIKERLAEDDCQNGYILDGFPRTVVQAQALDQMGIEMDVVVCIEVSDDDIVDRISGRRVCPGCGASYHIKFIPTADGVHCDKCGAEITLRKDDTPDVVLSRLKVYHDLTEPLKDYYQAKGKLKLVYGQEKVEDTTRLTFEAIKGIN